MVASGIKIDEEKAHKQPALEKSSTEETIDTDKYVDAVVPKTDDPTLPVFTFRVLILGTLWCVLLGVANAILTFRTNPFTIDAVMATLLSFPMGKALAKILPEVSIGFGRFKFSLNPGPFSVKEHVLISIMASAGAAGAYGIDNVIVQRMDRFIGNTKITIIESLAWVFSTQFIGYGIAGISRRFLIKPKAMLWPGILSQVALFVTLHNNDEPSDRYKMSRFRFFWLAFIGIFVYSWIPEYFFTCLQAVAVVCLVSKNKTARFLGSVDFGNGVGIGALTFSWQIINGNNPITTPFVYYMNIVMSNISFSWIAAPILYFTNRFKNPRFQNKPYNDDPETMRPVLNSVLLYNKDGVPIPSRDLMDKKTYDLDVEKFNANRPIYITEYFALTYMSNFLALSATFSHVILWHGKDIYRRFKEAMKQMQQDDADDIHNRLMSVYPDIPEWAYGVYLACCIAFMSFVVSNTAFTMPIWAVFLGVGVTSLAIIPLGTVEAISGKRIYLNVITQMTIGLLIPGQTISIMAYKSLGTNGALQAMTLISDLKLGHYMKVPPVAMVGAQLLGTFVGAFTTTFTCWFVMDHMNIGAGDWKATNYSIFYSAGAIWGAIGPRRFFGIGTPYETLLFGFLIGFLLPFIPWIANKFYPHKFWRYVNFPLLLYSSGIGSYQSEFLVGLFVNIFFQLYLFRYQYDWWKKYTYVFSAAVSGATMVAILLIALLKNMNINAPVWWGNPQGDLDYYCYDDPWRSTE